jgi:ABC-type uncharacterized transport system ATPase subunit
MTAIVKQFGSVTALENVDLDLYAGEIRGLLGENGAGKTTLMNILYGLLQPDRGAISFHGEQVSLRDPRDAVSKGVGMVHQHFMLVPTLTVAENMLLSDPSLVVRKRNLRQVARRLGEIHEQYGLFIDPEARVWQLSVGEQQRVEIIRALYHGARILILDEPTATLTPFQVSLVLPKLRTMADEGAAIVFISHHLEEVMEWTDRITVLRRGKHVATLRPAETTTRELARLMVGRDVSVVQPDTAGRWGSQGGKQPGEADSVLVAEGLTAIGDRGTVALHEVTFSVRRGEIVAIAGVEGNGQAELEEVLFGLRAPEAGVVQLEGVDITASSPGDRLQRGLGLIPSDRYRRGVIRDLPVAYNLVFDRIGEEPFGSWLRVRKRAVFQRAAELVDRFAIRTGRLEQPVRGLSGGNAQRVVIARALSRELRGLVAAQPTRGLDVGAIEFVWEQLDNARDEGIGILLISTDLDEIFALADRCHVMYRGQIVASWPRVEFNREKLGLAMGGVADRDEVPADTRSGEPGAPMP